MNGIAVISWTTKGRNIIFSENEGHHLAASFQLDETPPNSLAKKERGTGDSGENPRLEKQRWCTFSASGAHRRILEALRPPFHETLAKALAPLSLPTLWALQGPFAWSTVMRMASFGWTLRPSPPSSSSRVPLASSPSAAALARARVSFSIRYLPLLKLLAFLFLSQFCIGGVSCYCSCGISYCAFCGSLLGYLFGITI